MDYLYDDENSERPKCDETQSIIHGFDSNNLSNDLQNPDSL